jgi:hypothetical protein
MALTGFSLDSNNVNNRLRHRHRQLSAVGALIVFWGVVASCVFAQVLINVAAFSDSFSSYLGPVSVVCNALPCSISSTASSGVTVNGAMPCNGQVTLTSGAGTFSSTCVAASSVCFGRDTTQPANAVSFAGYATGSVTVTENTMNSDVIQVICE